MHSAVVRACFAYCMVHPNWYYGFFLLMLRIRFSQIVKFPPAQNYKQCEDLLHLLYPIYDILLFRFTSCQKKHEMHMIKVSESLWKYKATLLYDEFLKVIERCNDKIFRVKPNRFDWEQSVYVLYFVLLMGFTNSIKCIRWHSNAICDPKE